MRSDLGPRRKFERLSRLKDYDVARKEPDPRGWTVVNRDGQAVGKVRDLIIDADRMRATYLDVELDTKLFDLGDDDPHVLVPVDRARADGRRLVVDDVSSTWVRDMCAARELHRHEFWNGWWHRDERDAQRHVGSDDLQRVVHELRPGESARIPVVQEEIIVERRRVVTDDADIGGPEMPRPAHHDEYAVNRAADEPPTYRR